MLPESGGKLSRGTEQREQLQQSLLEIEGADDALRVIEAEYKNRLQTGRVLEKRMSEVVFPVLDAEQRQRLIDALAVFDIFPWEESGVLIVDHRKDMEKLALLNIGVPPMQWTDSRIDTKYQFPYPSSPNPGLSEVAQPRRHEIPDLDDVPQVDVNGDPIEIDIELGGVINDFYAGRIETEDEKFVKNFGNLPSLNLFPRKYFWREKKLIHSRTGEVVTEEMLQSMREEARGGNQKVCNELINIHTGLVLSVLKRVRERYPNADPDDLFQEGLIGLHRAMQTHDPEKGKFTTHAVISIESKMRRFAFQNLFPLHIPEHIQTRRTFLLRNTDDETLLKKLKDAGRPMHPYVLTKLRRMYLTVHSMTSLEEMKDDEIATALRLDTIGPLTDTTPENHLYRADTYKKISEAISTLPPREELVIRFYFGITNDAAGNLDTEEPSYSEPTLDELAEVLGGITRGRAGQIIHKALRSLRHPAKVRRYAPEEYEKMSKTK